MTEIVDQQTDVIAVQQHPVPLARESARHPVEDELVEDELVEDISIDGMCGVY